MENEKKTGIILQARLGSSRLPGKMLMPFYKEKSILEILTLRLVDDLGKDNVIIATSTNEKDDAIEEFCIKHKVKYYRGAENNVLERFIGAAEKYNCDTVVRVCADNPFLLSKGIQDLIQNFNPTNTDYLSFGFKDGTPVIKAHIGLYAEIVTLEALKKVSTLTNEALYTEHVTNYIYANKDSFRIKFLNLPVEIESRKDIRLTVDTQNDFDLVADLYQTIGGENYKLDNLIEKIDSEEKYGRIMQAEIKKNTK